MLGAPAWGLGVHRDPGTFVAEREACSPQGRAAVPVGTWTGVDGEVRRDVRFDGQSLHPGERRPASAYRPLGPWPAPGGDGVVHESTVPLAQVLQALVVVVVAGTRLTVDGRYAARPAPPRAGSGDETRPPGDGAAA